MTYETISILAALLCAALAGSVSFKLLDPACGPVVKACTEFAGMVRKKQHESPGYHRMEAWLKKNGAAYHIGKKTDPIRFAVICILLFFAGFAAGISISPGAGLLIGAALSAFFPLCVPVLNRSDNRRMLPDIRLIYHSLGVQIKSGIYVTDALAECATSVKNARLKDALSGFYADVIMKADIYSSLEKFRSSFDDRYIDSLCITVVQALESGQAVELLSDISEQIKDMEEEVFEARKASLDRVLTLSQLLVLGAVLGTALYTCVIYMMGRATGFRGF